MRKVGRQLSSNSLTVSGTEKLISILQVPLWSVHGCVFHGNVVYGDWFVGRRRELLARNLKQRAPSRESGKTGAAEVAQMEVVDAW